MSAAFRARIEAEVRQKLQEEAAAQMGGQPPPRPQQRPAPAMQPSISRARSVAGRDTADDSDTPLGDLLRR